VIRETQTYGDWEDLAAAPALSHQWMALDATQLAAYWRRCGLSANFWARYSALFVPSPAPQGRLERAAIADVVDYLLNELFENCAKFSGGPLAGVQFAAWLRPDRLDFAFTNHITPESAPPFVRFIEELLGGDPEELYFQRLEESAETGAKGSGLGYLTMMKDYGIRFGFRFEPVTDASVAVTVQAHVNLEETQAQ
jgi:hypothetical protein